MSSVALQTKLTIPLRSLWKMEKMKEKRPKRWMRMGIQNLSKRIPKITKFLQRLKKEKTITLTKSIHLLLLLKLRKRRFMSTREMKSTTRNTVFLNKMRMINLSIHMNTKKFVCWKSIQNLKPSAWRKWFLIKRSWPRPISSFTELPMIRQPESFYREDLNPSRRVHLSFGLNLEHQILTLQSKIWKMWC